VCRSAGSDRDTDESRRVGHAKPHREVEELATRQPRQGPTNVNLRHFPAGLLREAKAMAALRGKTLKQFVIECVERGVKEEKQKPWPLDEL
jgi:hypothetical protein